MFNLRKIKRTLSVLTTACLCLSCLSITPAHASAASAGTIQNIIVNSSGIVFFYMTGTRTTLPSCQTASATRWSFDSSTSGGQAMLAALLSAYGLGKQITVNGTGTCSVWADTEATSYIQVLG